MNKKLRQQVFEKFNGKCAYSGTELESDWQIDHIKPVIRDWVKGGMICSKNDCLVNMFPTQKIINHYKRSYSIEELRYYLSMVHEKLAKLPKNPRTEKSKRHITYMQKLAGYFGITPNKPFSGKFYFEQTELESDGITPKVDCENTDCEHCAINEWCNTYQDALHDETWENCDDDWDKDL